MLDWGLLVGKGTTVAGMAVPATAVGWPMNGIVGEANT
jgi:hypothetical protein